MASFRGRTPSCEALKGAFTDLYRLDDFESEKLGAGFFSEVFKVRHLGTGHVMVLKMNKQQSNTLNMRKEIQLMQKLNHPNILKFEAVCIHGGQPHALTEFIDGGTLEDLVQNLTVELPWSQRLALGLNITQGLQYLHGQLIFHRDLTSKNIFIRNINSRAGSYSAIIGDFGLATRIPNKTEPRLPQVGSPFWMSPECLRGEFYDQAADIFSFGILMCELIARVSADPDFLPRTQNFGVEYKAFSLLCPLCPPDFLKITFSCVTIDPSTRPSAESLAAEFSSLHKQQKRREDEEAERVRATARMAAEARSTRSNPVLKRFLSEGQTLMSAKKSPSEKARVHQRSCSKELPLETVASVCEEMCLADPHYTPPDPDQSRFLNPFATLPRLRKGRKIIGSLSDNFSSCFEVPSPNVSAPAVQSSMSNARNRTKSLPNSPVVPLALLPHDHKGCSSFIGERIPPLIPEFGREKARLQLSSQDDSNIGTWSGLTHIDLPLRRAGSWESGFFSSSNTDWMSEEGLLSSRSIGSSLLTVSDLEEDLRAASAFLSNRRTSSVFNDSLDDLSSGLDDLSGFHLRNYNFEGIKNEKYEKDIREIVDYFEKKCHVTRSSKTEEKKSSPEIARSQKIENLIKKVAENKSRARLNSRYGASPQQNLQVFFRPRLVVNI